MDEQTEGPKTKVCPDCAAEFGNSGERPIEEFYKVRAPKYAGGYRYGAYCKRHTSIRNNKSMREAKPGSPLREAKKRAQKKYAENHRSVVNETRRRWAQRHPEKQAAMYQDWVERNRARRKSTQDAWRERQRLRSRPLRVRRTIRAKDRPIE